MSRVNRLVGWSLTSLFSTNTAISETTRVNRILAHIVKYRNSAVSCAKTAEPIEMEFGTLSRMGPENMYYVGCR